MMELKNNDKVYVFKNNLFKNIDTEKKMFGVITNIERWEDTDSWGDIELDLFKISIKLENDKQIVIRHHLQEPFRRYSFIKADDFDKIMLNKDNITKKQLIKHIKEKMF